MTQQTPLLMEKPNAARRVARQGRSSVLRTDRHSVGPAVCTDRWAVVSALRIGTQKLTPQSQYSKQHSSSETAFRTNMNARVSTHVTTWARHAKEQLREPNWPRGTAPRVQLDQKLLKMVSAYSMTFVRPVLIAQEFMSELLNHGQCL